VVLNWQLISGSTCNGIQVYRSVDSINFYQIGEIPGICGNITSPQSYSFIDNAPVENKINYYRIELGGLGFSEIVSLEIISIEGNGNLVRPNPASNNTSVYFNNPFRELHSMVLFDNSGKLIANYETENNSFNFNISTLKGGVYFFQIFSDTKQMVTQGKLFVE
jgi:Secretion system C-terminal sorting domain